MMVVVGFVEVVGVGKGDVRGVRLMGVVQCYWEARRGHCWR